MLRQITDAKNRDAAQAAFSRALRGSLKNQGQRLIGFRGPGTKVTTAIYSDGAGQPWVGFRGPERHQRVKRYWNAFGIFVPDAPAQAITVEINFPTTSMSGHVSGFLAEDPETGDRYIMHSGKVGGGRKGIGKSAYLAWSSAVLVDVASDGRRKPRQGILIARLGDPDLTAAVWKFVRSVQAFKDEAAAGKLDTTEFKRRVVEYDRYWREFSGRKKGRRRAAFDYVSYHGDVVEALHDRRHATLRSGEKLAKTVLIDLFVRSGERRSEIYEVKTDVGRSSLYSAIGQLMTHGGATGESVRKFVVLPIGEGIPDDVRATFSTLEIAVIRYRLEKSKRKVRVTFVDG